MQIEKSLFSSFYKKFLSHRKPSKLDLKKLQLYYYRKLLKIAPDSVDSTIHKQRIVEEIKYLFKEQKDIKSDKEIEYLHYLCEDILKRIKNQELPPFPRLTEEFGYLDRSYMNEERAHMWRYNDQIGKEVWVKESDIKNGRQVRFEKDGFYDYSFKN